MIAACAHRAAWWVLALGVIYTLFAELSAAFDSEWLAPPGTL